MSPRFIVQIKGPEGWGDWRAFDDCERAETKLNWERSAESRRIAGRGGAGFTGERPRQMRLVEVLA